MDGHRFCRCNCPRRRGIARQGSSKRISFGAWRRRSKARSNAGSWIEIVPLSLGEERGTQAPVRIFLSHAQARHPKRTKLFEALVDHLKETQPVSAW